MGKILAMVFLLGCAEGPIHPELDIEQRNPDRGFERYLTYTMIRPIESIEISRDGVRYGSSPATGIVKVVVHLTHVCLICIRGLDELGNVDGGWVCKRSTLELEDVPERPPPPQE